MSKPPSYSAAFKAVLLAANNKGGSSPSYQQLADYSVVQSLFPYIAFQRRPHVRLLLVTLQKAFYGFFDGRQTLNLTRLQDEDGGHTIFLDEFDFLENDLVGLICRAPQISNPFLLSFIRGAVLPRHDSPQTPSGNVSPFAERPRPDFKRDHWDRRRAPR